MDRVEGGLVGDGIGLVMGGEVVCVAVLGVGRSMLASVGCVILDGVVNNLMLA